MVVLSVLILLFPLSSLLGQIWIFWVIFVLFMVATIGFAVYANTGNRFRIDIDPNEEPVKKEPQPLSRVKKLALIVFIVISVQITVGVGIMIVMGERDPTVTVYSDSVHISALYGTTIDFSRIAEVILIEENMQSIGIGTRTNGYSTNGLALKGNFNSAEYGMQLLFVYSSSSPTIQITPHAGASIYISYRDGETTREVYRKLSAAFSKSLAS